MSTSGLTEKERRQLLAAAERIHFYTTLHIEGYRRLIHKASDAWVRDTLTRIREGEEEYAAFWAERIRELGSDATVKGPFQAWKVGVMTSILGTKGFFEWTVVGEEEAIRALALQAEQIVDLRTSEVWRRYGAEARLHLDRMKTEVLGMEAWEIHGGSGVRDMIFGMNDGLVSTLAFVAGVVAAITDSYLVLLSGIAELFAGTISMAVGAYQSAKSELEVMERETQRRRDQRLGRRELVEFYRREGFALGEATAIVDRIASEEAMPMTMSALNKLGLAPEERGNPVKAGVLCGVSFGLAALVPIIPFACMTSNAVNALFISTVATLLSLFGVGALKTLFSQKSWIRSGLEMMAIGAAASVITYLIGLLLPI
jgi:VIT1/CCC1 family predicted Fe2+/Mn2+ transporter